MSTTVTEFIWQKKYTTGILEIDAQHQYLFALTNRLIRNVEENVSMATIGATIGQLEDYVEEHFKREEAMLHRAKYDGLQDHIEQHRKLTSQLRQFAQRLRDQTLSVNDFARFMQMWLSKHILQQDMKYLPAVKKNR